MVSTDRVSAIFDDARNVQADAARLLEAGDVRDAAEKAWCATKRATDALILARTGVEPEISSETTRGLSALATEHQGVRVLRRRYFSRQSELHGACFYLGVCEPLDEVHRRIRQTTDYISKAETLAGRSWFGDSIELVTIDTSYEKGPASSVISTNTVFLLRLEKTYYNQGFFNIKRDFDHLVRRDAGPVTLVLGDSATINGVVDRSANGNGTARVMGRAPLRAWFQQNYYMGDTIPIRFAASDRLIVG